MTKRRTIVPEPGAPELAGPAGGKRIAARDASVLSAGVIPIRFENERTPRVLLLRCYSYWDFPKGGVHAGENPLEAAIRELREETTLGQVHFPWGLEYWETEPYGGSGRKRKIARYYLGEVSEGKVSLPVVPWLGTAEHHEFRWLSFDGARKLVGDRVRAALDWASHKLEHSPGHHRPGGSLATSA